VPLPRAHRARGADPVIPLRDDIPSSTRPVVMMLLIAACVYVFLLTLSLPEPEAERVVLTYGVIPAAFTGHARVPGPLPLPARLLTNLVLHGGWLHLIGNMWFLWIFGDNVEDAMGHGPFLLFYLACGVAANLAHIAANPLSREPTIGASGAIAGVLGAYLVLFPRARVLCLVPLWVFLQFLWVPALLFLPLWVGMQLASGLLALGTDTAGGVAWWAHVGGFFTGVVLARAFARSRQW
jgi:membrane associated rhomboid family serine protease